MASVTIKSLATNDLISGTSDAAVDTLYFANSVTAQLNTVTCYNSHTLPVKVTFYIAQFNVAVTGHKPAWVQTIAAGKSEIIAGLAGHVIPFAGALQAFAGTTNVIQVNASGMEIA